MNAIVAELEQAIIADLKADSTFTSGTDEAKAFVITNYTNNFPAGAANIEAAFESLFIGTEGRTSGRIDWQKIEYEASL